MSNRAGRYVLPDRARNRATGETARDHWYLGQVRAPVGDGALEPAVEEVVETVVGLGPAKLETFRTVWSAPGSTAEELADRLDRDRSSVNRSLSSLADAGFVTRRRRILQGGGYVYEYHPCPRDHVRDGLRSAVEDWARAAADRIDEFLPARSDGGRAPTWVDRLVLEATGRVTPTEEYVYRHGIETARRAGESVPEAADRGEWTPALRREFVERGSEPAVRAALERLEAGGFIERADPDSEDDWRGPYWRLTPRGRSRIAGGAGEGTNDHGRSTG